MNRFRFAASCAIISLAIISAAIVNSAAAWEESPAVAAARRPIQPEYLARLAGRIEPDRQGKPERIAQYVDFFRKELANDSRLFAFNVDTHVAGDGTVRLVGFVEFPETRDALAGFLQALGFATVDNQLAILPDNELGARRFGFLQASNSLSLAEPKDGAEIVSECLLAEPLFLLREVNGYLLVHSGEGYLGYVKSQEVVRVDEATFAAYQQGPRVIVHQNCTPNDEMRIPAGARLKWLKSDERTVDVQLPDGSQISISADQCVVEPNRADVIEQAIQTARQLLGTRYLWGGKTSNGIDCSGLVQIAYQAAGVSLPRDSNQQVYAGRLVATRWCMSTLERGDTLYFVGPHGRIRHTAMYLGNGEYIQAETPVVTITSFDPQSPHYDAQRHASFVFGKRL